MLGTLEWAVGQRSVDSGLWPHAQKADPAKGSGKANSDTHQNFSWLKYSLFGMIGDLKASSSTTAKATEQGDTNGRTRFGVRG